MLYAVALLETVRTSLARLKSERGQGLFEYVLILSLIAIVAIVAMVYFAGRVTTYYSTVGNSIP